MAKQRLTAAEKVAEREQKLRAAERQRLAEQFRERRERAESRRVLRVDADGSPEWREFNGERRETRLLATLGAVLRRAFAAREEFRQQAARLADYAAENKASIEAGRQPWHRMGQRGAEFDAAREVSEARWEAAVWAADMAGVIVPELDERAYARHCAALAVRVVQPGPELWRVEWQSADGTGESVAHTSEVDALAHAEECYQRMTGESW